MSNQVKYTGTNAFRPIPKEFAPTVDEVDRHTEKDDYIIEYGVVDRVKMTGEKDTDFVVVKEVKELSRVNRQEYIDSYRDDVGILNIIEKVRLSGDISLLNQTGRIALPGVDKDALGRPVEDIADFTAYQVDKTEALEAYKKGIASAKDLKSLEAFSGMSFSELAKLKDSEIDSVLSEIKTRILSSKENEKKEGDN